MQPFFVSEEKLARQAYRYDTRYRLAALILMLTTLLQVPFIVLLYDQNRISKEEDSRYGFSLQKKAEIAAKLGGLKETEVQLGQIKTWEPILRARMPASAILGAVEQTIPRDVVLSRLALEAAGFRLVPLGYGSFRVPESYTITLEGEQKVPDPGVWEKFVGKFLSRLPPGSHVVSSGVNNDGNPRSDVLPCKAVLQAQANGNYFPLGVNKVDTDENL